MLYINQELLRHPEYLLPWNGVAASCSMKSKQPLLVISLRLLVTKWRGGEDLGSGKGFVLCSPHFTLKGKKMEILLVSTCLTCPENSMAFHAISLSVYCDNHLPCMQESQRSLPMKVSSCPPFAQKVLSLLLWIWILYGFFLSLGGNLWI